MPYGPRVMTYDTGSITASNSATTPGSASYFTVHALTGRIVKLAVLTNASGQITLSESGTNESLFTKLISSGTNYSVYYPKTLCTDNTGSTLIGASGNVWQETAVNNYVRVQHTAGSATTALSFSNVRIYYM